MQPSFSNLEVLKFAVSLESGGIDFYEEHASNAKGEVKQVFLKLADDEKRHAAYFQKLYDSIAKTESNFDYLFDETVTGFFNEFAKSEGFSREVATINTVKDALKEAIATEIITISYYENLLAFAKGKTAETLKVLIKEEEEHRDILKVLFERE